MPIVVPTPAAFATGDDLSVYLDKDVPVARADMAIRIATNRLISDLGWDPRASTRTYSAAAVTRVLLPALNVSALSTAGTITGTWNGLGTATATPPPIANRVSFAGWNAPVTWSTAGSVQFRSSFTGVITYDAGYSNAAMPEVFTDAILDAAATWLDNPRGLASYMTSVGAQQEQVSYSIAATSGGQDPRLDAYRLPGGIA